MLLLAMVAHELAHAAVAYSQGDDTAYMLGRMTLNPLPHLDPWMSFLLPAILWIGSGGTFTFGGARPVPVNPRKYRAYRRGDILVSGAGVTTNLVLAILCAAGFVAVGAAVASDAAVAVVLQRMLMWGVWLNLLLAVFNLIPIPPLDGSHLFYHLLPAGLGARYRSLNRFGILPLMALLVFFPSATRVLLTPAFLLFGWILGWIAPFQLAPGSAIFS